MWRSPRGTRVGVGVASSTSQRCTTVHHQTRGAGSCAIPCRMGSCTSVPACGLRELRRSWCRLLWSSVEWMQPRINCVDFVVIAKIITKTHLIGKNQINVPDQENPNRYSRRQCQGEYSHQHWVIVEAIYSISAQITRFRWQLFKHRTKFYRWRIVMLKNGWNVIMTP